jgi:membrane protease YdiL (CAAX protease family)
MSSTITVLIAALFAGCVTPRVPGPTHPPAPDRYTHAASADPNERASAADELAYDPHPAARDMLITLHMRDIDPVVRTRAAEAIVRRRDTSLVGVLATSAQRDPDLAVRVAATRAHRELRAWRKRPGTAGALSLLCPGCGHFYLGDDGGQGLAYLVSSVALVGGGLSLLAGETVSLSGGASSAKVPVGLFLVTTGQNLWFYSIFDAYRDARVARGDVGYRIAVSRETLGELASAPFRPGVLANPWVWGGVPAMLATGIAVSYLMSRGTSTPTSPTIFEVDRVNVFGRDFSRGTGYALGNAYFASLFGAVGVGEEALFRGVIQTELEERWGLPGVAISSVIFGAIHIGNFAKDARTAAIAIPTLSVLGGALGMAYRHNDHKLAVPVAMHFWYNLLLSATAFAFDPQNQPFVVQYVNPRW